MLLINKDRILELAKQKYGSTIPVPEADLDTFHKQHEELGKERDGLKQQVDTLLKEKEEVTKENEVLKIKKVEKEKVHGDAELADEVKKKISGVFMGIKDRIKSKNMV